MSTALGTTFTITVLTKMLEDAGLAESVQALIDGVSISIKSCA